MRLSALLSPGTTVLGADPATVGIRSLASDSRRVEPGALFAALPGTARDGRTFVGDALQRGAAAVLAASPLAEVEGRAAMVVDPDPRRGLARIAAAFFGRQPRMVAAVTGTNGKTTVAHLVAQIWRSLDVPAASLGTLGLDTGQEREPGGLTTPDPIDLHRRLRDLALAGIEHLAIEASSHGLDQRRLDGVEVAAAAFTNLSRDHLDYHGTEAEYFRAKCRLFEALLIDRGVAVLPADQPQFEPLRRICRERSLEVIAYGRSAGRIRLARGRADADGQDLELVVDGALHAVRLGLSGGFQADNLMAALGLAMATGIEPEAALARVGHLVAPPGRMQRVGRTGAGASIVVDYAHTPDALERALKALRDTTSGRLVVVFGCGGDRDPGKRRLMGAVAAARADRVIVTDDNPRSEDPARIRHAVLEGVPTGEEIADRRAAIRAGLAGLRSNDTLLIAGKGHETGQIVGGATLPFDDAAEARAAVQDLAAAP